MFGGERQVDVQTSGLQVTEDGVPVTARTLTAGERTKVSELAKRLISRADSLELGADNYASDPVLTEVAIEDADQRRTYRVQSGDDAPDELWELVGTLSDVARPPDAS